MKYQTLCHQCSNERFSLMCFWFVAHNFVSMTLEIIGFVDFLLIFSDVRPRALSGDHTRTLRNLLHILCVSVY